MFNFIRGMFDKPATTSDMTWNVPVFNYEYEGGGVDSPYLSHAEIQMLQQIVADAINLEEEYRKLDKMDAQSWVKGSAERDIFFKSVKKRSMRLKKLSALQYRLKHRIIAKG